MKKFTLQNLVVVLLLAFSAFTLFPSCGENEPETCETVGVTYTNFAKSLLNSNCATSGCHDANADISVGDYTSYISAKAVFTTNNRLLGAVNHDEGFSKMPKGGDKLSDCNIDKLTAWVNAGYPE